MTVSSLWVIAESANGALTSTSAELLSHARTLTTQVCAITWGADAAATADEVGSFGVTTLYDVGHLDSSLPGVPVAAAISALIAREGAPSAVLIPSSYDGRDIAGRLSAKLDRPVLTNVTGLVDDTGLQSEHAVFGGTLTVKSRFTAQGPGIFVIRAKSFAVRGEGGSAATVVPISAGDVGFAGGARITNSHVEERSGPKLEEAAVVISGGRGLGSASNYSLVEEVALLLHGAAGASRAIVDSGWVPYSHQVGQTGKTVKPTVYIACGISGATQHVVGMKGAMNVIAINKDPDAPIFQNADLGIVGDVLEVLPSLIEELRKRS
jgi:electron transfer flavoprotein alpha subunit